VRDVWARDRRDDRNAKGTLAKQWAALGVSTVASVWVLGFAAKHSPLSAVLVVIATVGCGAFTVWHRNACRSGSARVGLRSVAAVIGIAILSAVALPNRTSNDLWSYGTYGRMVVVHHVDPYVATPAQFQGDPFAQRVSVIWRHRSSVYGPVWLAVVTADAALVGPSALANRLFFQSLAALVAILVLIIIWRRSHSIAALVWLALHPVFLLAINSGHADLFIGLLILVGALLATRARGWLCGLVIGIAGLIKITALLGLLGIVLWAWRARQRHLIPGLLFGAGAIVLIAYAPIISDAAHVLANADHTVSTWSPWNGPADLILGHDAFRQVPNPLAYNATLEVIFVLGALLVVALALVVGWRTASTDPRHAAGATSAAYPIGAAYSLPWYSLWALPCVTDDEPSALAWVIWLQAAAMVIVLKFHDHPAGTIADAIPRFILTVILPVVWVAAFVAMAFRQSPTAITS
jgi:hypothetical protein